MLVSLCGSLVCDKEPHCSRFEYEEKLLEKMIRTELKCEDLTQRLLDVEHRMNTTLLKMTETMETKIQTVDDLVGAEQSVNDNIGESRPRYENSQTRAARYV